jgi:hypothetical protein
MGSSGFLGGIGSGRDRRGALLLLLPVLAGVLVSIGLVFHARTVNGRDGFPLDDPWIHLTYARCLHDHHTFAYFPGDPSTQGSTSPLYTGLLALGFSVTRNEKLLSYALGILFHALFLAAFALWAERRLGDARWSAFAALLVGLDSNLAILSVSGMETSLFLFLVAGAFLARASGRRLLTALALGLAVWVRPDGLILAALFGLLAALDWLRMGRARAGGAARRAGGILPTGAGRPLGVFALMLAAYFIFNLAVGHALLPNTFAAKTAYYRPNPRRLFLAMDLGPAFFRHGWVVLAPFALVGIGREAVRLARWRPTASRAEAGWAVGLPLAYFVLLPYAHRFSRYLVPAVPAFALLGVGAVRDLLRVVPRRRLALGAGVTVAATILGLQAGGVLPAARSYAELCQYHYQRHERTGRWLAEHTLPGAVVATHDIGAIAFYSGRRIVDVLGLTSPDAVRHLNKPDYIPYLESLFAAQGVTHLAVFRDGLGVDNVRPLFTADPRPEVMEVFPWIPGRTHLVPAAVDQLTARAIQALRANQAAQAVSILQAAINIDGRSSRLWDLAGEAWEFSARPERAEDCYRRSLALFPEAEGPRLRLSRVEAQLDRIAEARATLAPLVGRQPPYPGVEELRKLLGP